MEVSDPQQVYKKSKYTIEEYLAMERDSVEKHEYFKGRFLIWLVLGIGTTLFFQMCLGI